VKLADGRGVPATRAATAEGFIMQLERALVAGGPRPAEAVVGRGIG
jgi:hypothetical protein